MTAARPRPSAASDFARLVVVYLCLVLALQGFAAARALGAGPLHHHAGQTGPESLATLVFSHHGHQHLSDQRHHHAGDDHSVQLSVAPEDAAIDLAAFALTAALALLAIGTSRQGADHRRHVWRAAPGWACCSVPARSMFKPPRRT